MSVGGAVCVCVGIYVGRWVWVGVCAVWVCRVCMCALWIRGACVH